MNMDRVVEILRKHDELLDSMTKEERKAYYANVGLVVEDEPTMPIRNATVKEVSAEAIGPVVGYRATSTLGRSAFGNSLSRHSSRKFRTGKRIEDKKLKEKDIKIVKAR